MKNDTMMNYAPRRRHIEECKIDHIQQRIVLTKRFAIAANHYGTPEFKCLAEIRRNFPDYDVQARTNRKRSGKTITKGLTQQTMKRYITALFGEASPQYKAYQKQLTISTAYVSPYMYMRKWFLNQYPNWQDGLTETDAAGA